MQVKTFIFLIALWMSAACAFGMPIYYADLMNPPRQMIFDGDKISAFGVNSSLKVCPPEDDFLCFDGGGLKFAVPKMVLKKKNWMFSGQMYYVQKSERFSIFGLEVDVMFIKKSNDPITYLYSEDRGVVGFGVKGRHPRFFLLENACGFGAPSTCGK